MVYVVTGSYSFIEKTLRDYEKKESEKMKFDLSESSIQEVLQSLNTYSLFASEKQVIVTNLESLEEEENLRHYLENPSSNDLFFTTTKKLDERKKITKLLKKYAIFLEEQKEDIKKYIQKLLKDYKVDYGVVDQIKEACSGNYLKINQELAKLKEYKGNEKTISLRDIDQIMNKNFNQTVFDLIHKIEIKDGKTGSKLYHQLIRAKEDPIKILVLLANHFRLVYQIKVKKKTKNDREILQELKLNPYRFEKLKEASFHYEEKELVKMLKEFARTDEKIKTGQQEKTFAVELCILKVAK